MNIYLCFVKTKYMDKVIEKLKKVKENMPDLIIKEIKVQSDIVYIVSLQTVCSSDRVNDFILNFFKDKKIINNNIYTNIIEELSNYIPSINFSEIKEDEVMYYILNGFTVIINKDSIITFETKADLDRSISEPSSEPVIKGPKDSFNENYNTNIGLIRKRIKDENLYLKEYVMGDKTNTKVAIMYMNDIIDKELLEETIQKITNIKTEKIFDSFYIKGLLKKENKTFFPTILSTERPDSACKILVDGKIIVLVENSPSVLIIPTFFLDFFHNNEDTYQKSFYSNMVKFIRFLAFFLSILTPAIYLALITHDQQILPTSLLVNFAMQRSSVPFPAIIEAIILTVIFEILYEGDSRTPTTRGTTLSVLGALVLGDAAVQAGIVSIIMVIVVAVTAISSLIFSFHDLQAVIRYYRFLTMAFATAFGILGLFISSCILLVDLCSIKSFGKPYLIPYIPFFKNISEKTRMKRGLLEQNITKE